MHAWIRVAALCVAIVATDVVAQDAVRPPAVDASETRAKMRRSSNADERYIVALLDAIEAQWVRPPGQPGNAECLVRITQRLGGEVVSAHAEQTRCTFDAATRASIEAAALKASPLPHAGFQQQFRPEVILHFGDVATMEMAFWGPPHQGLPPVFSKEAERQRRLAAMVAMREDASGEAQERARELKHRYLAEITRRVLKQWLRPDDVPVATCAVRIEQVPGGQVVGIDILPGCPFDKPTRTSVENAIIKASPLPYEGYESVFMPVVTLGFRPE